MNVIYDTDESLRRYKPVKVDKLKRQIETADYFCLELGYLNPKNMSDRRKALRIIFNLSTLIESVDSYFSGKFNYLKYYKVITSSIIKFRLKELTEYFCVI